MFQWHKTFNLEVSQTRVALPRTLVQTLLNRILLSTGRTDFKRLEEEEEEEEYIYILYFSYISLLYKFFLGIWLMKMISMAMIIIIMTTWYPTEARN